LDSRQQRPLSTIHLRGRFSAGSGKSQILVLCGHAHSGVLPVAENLRVVTGRLRVGLLEPDECLHRVADDLLDHFGPEFGPELPEGYSGVGDDLRQEGQELAIPTTTDSGRGDAQTIGVTSGIQAIPFWPEWPWGWGEKRCRRSMRCPSTGEGRLGSQMHARQTAKRVTSYDAMEMTVVNPNGLSRVGWPCS